MRVLLVEDEADLAAALATSLRHDGYAVDLALDGPGGIELAEITEYDLLILDLTLPGMDGLEVCRRLRAMRPHLLILMVTARGQVAERVTGLDAGADDYLVKPFALDEVRARLRALLRRAPYGQAPLLALGNLVLDPATRHAYVDGRPMDLTRRELAVLTYLVRHAGTVISQEELLGTRLGQRG